MKKLFVFLSILTLGLLVSCEKDTENNNDGTITMKIDGKDWTSLKEKTSVTISSSSMSITGTSADGSSLTLFLKGTTAKTYTLTQISTSTANFKDNTSASFLSTLGNDASATAIVSEINIKDSLVTGTFNFTGFQSVNGKKIVISGGSINKIVISKPIILPPGVTSFFKCKINGSQFNAALTSGIKNPIFDVINISGAGQSGSPSISINVDKDASAGATFSLGGLDAYYSVSTSGSTYSAVSGTLKVTKHDKTAKRLEATFNFDGETIEGQKAKITEGSFSISY